MFKTTFHPEQGKKVVGREGFEPSTNWLKANCSTN